MPGAPKNTEYTKNEAGDLAPIFLPTINPKHLGHENKRVQAGGILAQQIAANPADLLCGLFGFSLHKPGGYKWRRGPMLFSIGTLRRVATRWRPAYRAAAASGQRKGANKEKVGFAWTFT
jgi:hypothetical protein